MINITEKLTSVEDFLLKQVKWITLIAGVGIILLSLHDCHKSNDLVLVQNELNKAFSQKRVDSTTIIEQKQQLVLKDNNIVKKDEQIEKLSNLKADIQYKTITKVQNVLVPFHDTAIMTRVLILGLDTMVALKDSNDCLVLPTKAQLDTKYFNIEETITKNGVEIDSLSLLDSTSIVIGDSKKLFHPKSIVRITHSNPYISTTSMNNVVVDDQLRKQVLKGTGIGIGMGLGLAIISGLLIGFIHK